MGISTITTTSTQKASVQPLPVPEESKVNFGAVITDIDVENLTGKSR
jgi:hypothetical protein